MYEYILEKLSSVLDFDMDMLSFGKSNSVYINLHPFLDRSIDPNSMFVSDIDGKTESELLDMLYTCMYECFKRSSNLLLGGAAVKYQLIHLDGYWLNKLFYIEELATNDKNTVKILKLIDKRTNMETLCYITHFENPRLKQEGWLATSSESECFIPLHQKLNPISAIEVTIDPTLRYLKSDLVKGHLFLPTTIWHKRELVVCRVVSQRLDRVEVEYMRIDAERDSNLDIVYVQVIIYIENGRMEVEENKLEHPDWLRSVKDWRDTIRNPLNSYLHDYLPESDVPIYEGKNMYVTSTGDIYVQLAGEWILADKSWLLKRKNSLPFIVEDMLAMELMGIEIH